MKRTHSDIAKIFNKEDIKKYESLSIKVSPKYVPIKTSTLVDALEPTFKFNHGRQYRYGSTAHYVEMTKGDAISLYIENSFDKQTAFRVSFNFKGFIFGRVTQVHKGQSAKEIADSLDKINEWYTNAVNSIETMKLVELDRSEMEELAQIAFKFRGIDAKHVVNINYNHKNALDFVMHIVDGIKAGDFIRTSPKGNKVFAPITRQSFMVELNNKIWKYLATNNPELFV